MTALYLYPSTSQQGSFGDAFRPRYSQLSAHSFLDHFFEPESDDEDYSAHHGGSSFFGHASSHRFAPRHVDPFDDVIPFAQAPQRFSSHSPYFVAQARARARAEAEAAAEAEALRRRRRALALARAREEAEEYEARRRYLQRQYLQRQREQEERKRRAQAELQQRRLVEAIQQQLLQAQLQAQAEARAEAQAKARREEQQRRAHQAQAEREQQRRLEALNAQAQIEAAPQQEQQARRRSHQALEGESQDDFHHAFEQLLAPFFGGFATALAKENTHDETQRSKPAAAKDHADTDVEMTRSEADKVAAGLAHAQASLSGNEARPQPKDTTADTTAQAAESAAQPRRIIRSIPIVSRSPSPVGAHGQEQTKEAVKESRAEKDTTTSPAPAPAPAAPAAPTSPALSTSMLSEASSLSAGSASDGEQRRGRSRSPKRARVSDVDEEGNEIEVVDMDELDLD